MDGPERQRQISLGSDGGQTPGERGVGFHRGGGVEGDLIADEDDPGLDRRTSLLGRIDARRPRSPESSTTPGLIAGPCDRPPGLRHRTAERVRILVAECTRHGVLLLEEHPVEGATGDPVELDPHAEQRAGRACEAGEVHELPQARRAGAERLEDVDVPKATMGLLEVGFEEEGDIALLEVALGHLLLEGREELRGELGLPQAPDLLDHGHGHLLISPDDPGIEEAERDAKIRLGDPEDLLGATYRVVDLDPLVPQRVPERLGDLLDVASSIVDEQQVEVGVRAELSSSVAPDGHEGDPLRRSACGGRSMIGQACIGEVGERPTELRPSEPRLLEKLVSLGAEGPRGHAGTVASRLRTSDRERARWRRRTARVSASSRWRPWW